MQRAQGRMAILGALLLIPVAGLVLLLAVPSLDVLVGEPPRSFLVGARRRRDERGARGADERGRGPARGLAAVHGVARAARERGVPRAARPRHPRRRPGGAERRVPDRDPDRVGARLGVRSGFRAPARGRTRPVDEDAPRDPVGARRADPCLGDRVVRQARGPAPRAGRGGAALPAAARTRGRRPVRVRRRPLPGALPGAETDADARRLRGLRAPCRGHDRDRVRPQLARHMVGVASC